MSPYPYEPTEVNMVALKNDLEPETDDDDESYDAKAWVEETRQYEVNTGK